MHHWLRDGLLHRYMRGNRSLTDNLAKPFSQNQVVSRVDMFLFCTVQFDILILLVRCLFSSCLPVSATYLNLIKAIMWRPLWFSNQRTLSVLFFISPWTLEAGFSVMHWEKKPWAERLFLWAHHFRFLPPQFILYWSQRSPGWEHRLPLAWREAPAFLIGQLTPIPTLSVFFRPQLLEASNLHFRVPGLFSQGLVLQTRMNTYYLTHLTPETSTRHIPVNIDLNLLSLVYHRRRRTLSS